MLPDDIPDDVLHFIEHYIDSVPHLEALLMLSEQPADTWSDEQIAKRLYIPSDRARTVLNDLVRHRLVVATASPLGYRYDPTSIHAPIVANVAAAYRRHLALVASLIHSRAPAGVRDFARAFEIKKRD